MLNHVSPHNPLSAILHGTTLGYPMSCEMRSLFKTAIAVVKYYLNSIYQTNLLLVDVTTRQNEQDSNLSYSRIVNPLMENIFSCH